MAGPETYRAAFSDPPGTNLAGIPIGNLKLLNPYLSYGLKYYDACARHVKETFHASRIFVVASKTLAATSDRVAKLVDAIGRDNVVGIRNGITPHTPWSEVLEITKECREKSVDCVVTIGAGSITDGCKLVVFCLANDISDADRLSQYSVESTDIPAHIAEPKVPLITIPTSLSGGEYFALAGGTDDSTNHKKGFLHSGMGSKLIILDPELCLTTPDYHWLSTGVRSLDHCIEALCSLESTANSDEKAERGLRLLAPNLLKCKADAKNVEARFRCQLAVGLAMDNIRTGIPMGGSHAIGHQLGPLGVPHGITSCIMCPAVMKWNIKHGTEEPRIAQKQRYIADILRSEAEVAKRLKDAALNEGEADLGDILDVIIRALGLPRSLHELGVAPDIRALSQRALADFWAPTNPIPLVRAEQVQEILGAVA